MNKLFLLIKEFSIPAVILLGIFIYLILNLNSQNTLAAVIAWSITLLGSYKLFTETVRSVLKKQFALDYIAILAIVLALLTKEYLVAGILALMIAGGRNLENYAINQAKKSLTALIERIPDKITLWEKGHPSSEVRLKDVNVGQEIFIKKGEVIALDGVLISTNSFIDESSLTGEAEFAEKVSGDQIFSGTINMGGPIALKVTKSEEDSTYNKIIQLVKSAQEEKPPLVRLADKYSMYFTVITLTIAGISFYISGFDLMRVLSVLAIATPCPLIIATPIALLGGVNAAAKQRIIIKRLASLEALSKVNMIIFDKTGTITIGKPRLTNVRIITKSYTEKEILAIAEALERNSLHPLAKAVVNYASSKKSTRVHAVKVEETIGLGIQGFVNGKKYLLAKLKEEKGMSIALSEKGKVLATFEFEDQIKEDSKEVIKYFKAMGMQLLILTGDKWEAADKLSKVLGKGVEIKAELSPVQKLDEINKLKSSGKVVAMIGDGINDAPSLASADVGIVFSNEEQTAASEAADIVFLGGEFKGIPALYKISKNTINIAKQSIIGGIGLSIIGMIFASVGLVPPIYGAVLQEAIDVAVILNAIRASKVNV